jgi:GNAT superfamily N-acetyltransferase
VSGGIRASLPQNPARDLHSSGRYAVHIWNPALDPWDALAPDIAFLERQAFEDKAFDTEYLRSEISDPAHVVALLTKSPDARVLGFTYALPVTEIEPHRSPRAANTAYIADSVLEAGIRGQGHIGPLMSCLEDELRHRGFEYLERHAAVAHGYARKVCKHYSARIEVQRRPNMSEWGPQVFFRIRL